MASISTAGDGNRSIQFKGLDGRRKTIRLGRHAVKVVEAVKAKVELLLSLAAARQPLDPATAAWAAGISDELHAKLAAQGLLDPRHANRLGEFVDGYVAARRADGTKPGTVVNLERVATDLKAVLGAATELRAIAPADADRYRVWHLAKGNGRATVHGSIKKARQFFSHAVDLKLIPANPFAAVRSKDTTSPERQHYVSPADGEAMIAVANGVWKTVVALARFGGLRNPSEVLSLRWPDVDFAADRMTVTSPKTEHHAGRGSRVVPLFAALRPHLDAARAAADPADEYVIGGETGDRHRKAADSPAGWKNSNMRSTLKKIIKRAGLAPWPRLFNNLRSSCETDLMQHHPIQVVTAWLGNTPQVALTHYLQTLEGDFAKAVAGAAQSDARALHKPVASADARKRPRTILKLFEVENEGEIRGGASTDGDVQQGGMTRVGVEPTNVRLST